jgi:tRNA(Arg) A34 adenosine deaminase TadA
MCLGAIYWARPKAIYFGNTKEDAATIGFDDSMIYDEIRADLNARKIPAFNILRKEANATFVNWTERDAKKHYRKFLKKFREPCETLNFIYIPLGIVFHRLHPN